MKYICSQCYELFDEDTLPYETSRNYVNTGVGYLCIDEYSEISACPHCGGFITKAVRCGTCKEYFSTEDEKCPFCGEEDF